MFEGYSIRQLVEEEWQLYKAIRLESLQKSHGVFGGNYADESVRPDSEWQERLGNKKYAFFGVFFNVECVGLAGVVEFKEDAQTALLIAHYIREGHRGKGLANLFYKASIAWAKENGYKRAIVSHRYSNLASKAANQKVGFVYTHSESRTWPDGVTEDNVYYELIL